MAMAMYQRPVVRASVIRLWMISTVVAGSLVAKGADLGREIESLSMVLGTCRGCFLCCTFTALEGRVVSTNGDQFVDALGFQGVNDPLPSSGSWWGWPAGPEHGTAAEVQATDIGNVHGFQGVEITLHARETVTNAVHLSPRQAGPITAAAMTPLIPGAGPPPTTIARAPTRETAFQIRGNSLPRVRDGSKASKEERAIFWPMSQVDPFAS